MKLLFVCTGNICRSPMAEHMFRNLLGESSINNISVDSAGVAAMAGREASQPAVKVLEEEGIESIKMHQAKPVTDLSPGDIDLVLTMTRAHISRLPSEYESEGIQTDLLKEYAGMQGGFSDPYGGPVSEYRQLKDEMKPVLQNLLGKVKNQIRN